MPSYLTNTAVEYITAFVTYTCWRSVAALKLIVRFQRISSQATLIGERNGQGVKI